MEIDFQALLIAVQQIKISIDEAKNLCFNGKIVQCDRKLQGVQVRCNNVLDYLMNYMSQDKANAVVVQPTNEKAKSE